MIIPVGFGQATIVFSGNGLPTGAAITFGYQVNNLLSPDEEAGFHLGMFNSNVVPELSSAVATEYCEIKRGPNTTGATGVDTGGSIGGKSSEAAPPNVAWLVTKRTALGGRMNRGRLFLPGVLETEISPGGVYTATGAQAAVSQWLEDMETNSVPMVILHNASGDPTPVTELISEARVATQRRRLRR